MVKGKITNLRKIRKSDLPGMVEWRNKKHVRRWFFNQNILTLEKQLKWYKRYLKNSSDRMFIIGTKGNVPIGTIALCNIDYRNKRAEFGRLMIAESVYLRKGYAADAALALINFAFTEMGLNRLYLESFADDKPAVDLYKKLGFKIEGILRKHIFINRCSRDVIYMGLLKEEFKNG